MELSGRAYARHRGISETAVRKALKEGRITKNKNDKIDPKQADKQWDINTDPAQIKEVAKPQEEVNNYNPAPLGPSYQQSRAIKEAYNAKLTRLQFEKESKILCRKDCLFAELSG